MTTYVTKTGLEVVTVIPSISIPFRISKIGINTLYSIPSSFAGSKQFRLTKLGINALYSIPFSYSGPTITKQFRLTKLGINVLMSIPFFN